MAFFKFRKNGAEQSGPTPAPESLEVLRKRARHRLIGAAALVLLGVVGFPLLFDSQPRPVAVNIAIDIPDKAKVAPLVAAPVSAPVAPNSAPAAASIAASEPAIAAKPSPEPSPAVSAPAKVEPKADHKAAPADIKADAKVEPKSDGKVAAKTEVKAPSSAKAQALLDGKEPAKPAAAAPRYTVQVGAFSDAQKAHDARATLEKAGIKSYTQVVTTPDGKRTRVRAGPWEDKAEAEKTAEKIKKLKLSAAVLTL